MDAHRVRSDTHLFWRAAAEYVSRVLPYGWAGRLLWIKRHGFRDLRAYVPREIPSFMHDHEAMALRRLIRSLPPNAQVVEVGCWIGRSSILIAKALRGSEARLYCIDLFAGVDGAGESERDRDEYAKVIERVGEQRQAFEKNVARNGVGARISVLAGPAHSFAVDWSLPLDAVFIDADHGYDAVRQDVLDWSPHLKTDGWLVLHDVYFEPPANPEIDYSGPAQVARELLLDSPDWSQEQTTFSLLRVQKRE